VTQTGGFDEKAKDVFFEATNACPARERLHQPRPRSATGTSGATFWATKSIDTAGEPKGAGDVQEGKASLRNHYGASRDAPVPEEWINDGPLDASGPPLRVRGPIAVGQPLTPLRPPNTGGRGRMRPAIFVAECSSAQRCRHGPLLMNSSCRHLPDEASQDYQTLVVRANFRERPGRGTAPPARNCGSGGRAGCYRLA